MILTNKYYGARGSDFLIIIILGDLRLVLISAQTNVPFPDTLPGLSLCTIMTSSALHWPSRICRVFQFSFPLSFTLFSPIPFLSLLTIILPLPLITILFPYFCSIISLSFFLLLFSTFLFLHFSLSSLSLSVTFPFFLIFFSLPLFFFTIPFPRTTLMAQATPCRYIFLSLLDLSSRVFSIPLTDQSMPDRCIVHQR